MRVHCCYSFLLVFFHPVKDSLLSPYTLNLSCSDLEDCHLECLLFRLCNLCDLSDFPALLRWRMLAVWQVTTDFKTKPYYSSNYRGNVVTVSEWPFCLQFQTVTKCQTERLNILCHTVNIRLLKAPIFSCSPMIWLLQQLYLAAIKGSYIMTYDSWKKQHKADRGVILNIS